MAELSTGSKIALGIGITLALAGTGVGLYFALRPKEKSSASLPPNEQQVFQQLKKQNPSATNEQLLKMLADQLKKLGRLQIGGSSSGGSGGGRGQSQYGRGRGSGYSYSADKRGYNNYDYLYEDGQGLNNYGYDEGGRGYSGYQNYSGGIGGNDYGYQAGGFNNYQSYYGSDYLSGGGFSGYGGYIS